MKRINVRWGAGTSDLFLDLTGKVPRILDFEFDEEELHERCGGETYYTSLSGCSGAGWLENLGPLLRIGTYRVDTLYNSFQNFISLGRQPWNEYKNEAEILVAVPYESHSGDKIATLREYPTVLRVWDKVIYCDFESNFVSIIQKLFSYEDLPEECEINDVDYEHRGHRTLKRFFFNNMGDRNEVSMEFYNLCSMDNTPNPWDFFQEELEPFRAGWSKERMFQLLGVRQLEDGTFAKAIRIADEWYYGELLSGNPLETGELTAGWQRLADDVLIRFYDRSNKAHLVAYAPAQAAYEKLARRLAKQMGMESEEFISYVSKHEGQYAEYELIVPKVSYLLNQTSQLAELRKGLARKVRKNVMNRTRQWIGGASDQKILEAAPDDMIITIDDSLAAGNCRSGTEEFRNRYFPGQAQTTARELKKFSDNCNVMRIFRHLAVTGRFGCEIKAVG